ncbi:hypothetical protein A3Q56_05227 [Intoshia linei]|uniref:Arf-GAP domain-containing protein n=1 Tax=Intoshia linei TaxID=1819745 RepID=A0A177AYA9_9BILA|nr:hypothetical protein A3Q56_05227 [Intoshia linei]
MDPIIVKKFVCDDCGDVDVYWCSLNLGVFICNQCAIVHRKLGRHISNIKTIYRGRWHPNLIKLITKLNTQGSNDFWEYFLSQPQRMSPDINATYKPNKDSTLTVKEKFINSKYLDVRFLDSTIYNYTSEELNNYLHRAVMRDNLVTTLQLLNFGADPNYFSTETNLYTLHQACSKGCALQAEMLIIYGADYSMQDDSNFTAVEYSINNNHLELGQRMHEINYELTDSITHYLCNETPTHRNSCDFIVPKIIEDNKEIDVQKKQKSLEKIKSMNSQHFLDLATDIYDECIRRHNEFLHKKLMETKETIVGYLPKNENLPAHRNKTRKCLSLISEKKMAYLIIDILNEAICRLNIVNKPMENVKYMNISSGIKSDSHSNTSAYTHDNTSSNSLQSSTSSDTKVKGYYDFVDEYKLKFEKLNSTNAYLMAKVERLNVMIEKLCKVNGKESDEVKNLNFEKNQLCKKISKKVDLNDSRISSIKNFQINKNTSYAASRKSFKNYELMKRYFISHFYAIGDKSFVTNGDSKFISILSENDEDLILSKVIHIHEAISNFLNNMKNFSDRESYVKHSTNIKDLITDLKTVVEMTCNDLIFPTKVKDLNNLATDLYNSTVSKSLETIMQKANSVANLVKEFITLHRKKQNL